MAAAAQESCKLYNSYQVRLSNGYHYRILGKIGNDNKTIDVGFFIPSNSSDTSDMILTPINDDFSTRWRNNDTCVDLHGEWKLEKFTCKSDYTIKKKDTKQRYTFDEIIWRGLPPNYPDNLLDIYFDERQIQWREEAAEQRRLEAEQRRLNAEQRRLAEEAEELLPYLPPAAGGMRRTTKRKRIFRTPKKTKRKTQLKTKNKQMKPI